MKTNKNLSEEKKEALLILFGDAPLEEIIKWIKKSNIQEALNSPDIKIQWAKIFPSTNKKKALNYLETIGLVVFEIPNLEDEVNENNAYNEDEILHISYCTKCKKLTEIKNINNQPQCAEGHIMNVIP